MTRLALSGVLATALVAAGGWLSGGAAGGLWWSAPLVPARPLVAVVPALALFYGGLILACRSWSRLRAAAPGLGPRGVLLVFCLWAAPLLLTPPLASRDVYAYAAAGQVAATGLDPYEVGPSALGRDDPIVSVVDPLWRDAPTPYGPLFVGLASAVADRSRSVFASVLMLRFLAVAGLLLAAWGLTRLTGPERAAPALALLLGNPLVLLHLVSGAHNEALMVGLLVAGLAVGEKRPVLGMVVCGLAAGIKAPAFLGVLYLGWTSTPRTAPWPQRVLGTASAGLVGLATLSVAGALSGLGWGWLGTVSGATEVTAYLAPTTMVGTAIGQLALVQAAGVLAAGGATVVLLARSHRTGLVGLGTALVLVALLGPVVQPWYLAWGGAVLAAAASPQRNRLVVAGSTALCFAVLPAGPDVGRQALAQPLAVVVALAVLTVLALAARRPTG